MNDKKLILGIVLATAILVGGGMWWVVKSGEVAGVTATPGTKVVLEKNSVDFGEVKIGDGVVEARYKLKNEGDQTLKLFNGTTSCACTKAKVVTKKGESQPFGMHTKSKEVTEVAPGEEAEIVAIFDPAFHGPSGVGPISRQITVTTNDPNLTEISLTMIGSVIK